MLIRKYLIATTLCVALVALPAWSAAPTRKTTPTTKRAATTTKKTVTAVCPVMGSKIPDVTKAAGKSVYKGKTYYFCCAGCKPLFDKDPQKYIKNAPSKKRK